MAHSGIWWVDLLYRLGVAVLSGAADLFGITFAEISVYVFGVAGPLVLAATTLLAWWYRRRWLAAQESREEAPARAEEAQDDGWTSPLVELERREAHPPREEHREPPRLSEQLREDEAEDGDFLRVPRRQGFAAREEPDEARRPVRLGPPRDPFGREPDLEEVRPDNDDRPFRRRKAAGHRDDETPRLDLRPRPSDRL